MFMETGESEITLKEGLSEYFFTSLELQFFLLNIEHIRWFSLVWNRVPVLGGGCCVSSGESPVGHANC